MENKISFEGIGQVFIYLDDKSTTAASRVHNTGGKELIERQSVEGITVDGLLDDITNDMLRCGDRAFALAVFIFQHHFHSISMHPQRIAQKSVVDSADGFQGNHVETIGRRVIKVRDQVLEHRIADSQMVDGVDSLEQRAIVVFIKPEVGASFKLSTS